MNTLLIVMLALHAGIYVITALIMGIEGSKGMPRAYWEWEASLVQDPDNEDCQSLYIDEDGAGREIAGKIADPRVASRLLRLWNDNRGSE